jgi:endonuclease I
MKIKITNTLSLFILPFIYLNAQPPSGYYNDAAGRNCASLKTALRGIINGSINFRLYADLRPHNATYEIKPRTVGVGSANVIYDIYSTVPNGTDPYQFTPTTQECGNYNGESDCYNREHSVPQSWFGGGTLPGPGTDFHHVYPTDGFVNGKRGNQPFGEVASASYTSLNGSKLGSSSVAGITGNVFEPLDSFKGDVARSFLYFVTMYENNIGGYASNADAVQCFASNTFPSVKIDYLRLMIKWHKLDPVSTKERNRNNAGYIFQNNRNPFIDRPDWVDSVWNASCPGLSLLPVDILTFGGKLNQNKLNLFWEVGEEVNLNLYEVQRSVNGVEYNTIATIKANGSKNYSYDDNITALENRRLYYRIVKKDKDGIVKYSKIFSLHIPLLERVSIYPNPAKNFININLANLKNEVSISLSDIMGKELMSKKVQANGSNYLLDIAQLINGNYFLTIKTKEKNVIKKVVVSK